MCCFQLVIMAISNAMMIVSYYTDGVMEQSIALMDLTRPTVIKVCSC